MKSNNYRRVLLLAIFLCAGFITMSQTTSTQTKKKINIMKTYLIERDIPGAGALTGADLKGISQKSCSVLQEMGPSIQWIQSYVTGDKIFCVYKAENEQLLRDHAQKGGFPINKITEIAGIISPETAK